MMDTDFHAIKDNTSQKTINAPRPIHIGNHVWIGSRVTVLKGVRMASNTIIAAASVITKSFDEEYCVIGGSGKDASILRHNVQWEN
jgi:acetyltransferase-like isoleucine patch superfamily enzyme